MHGHEGGAADRLIEEMRHQLIKLIQRWPSVVVTALLGQVQLFAMISALRIARSSSR